MVHHVSFTKHNICILLFLLTFLSLTHAQSATTCSGTECQSSSIHSGQILCNGPNSCQESTLTSDDQEYGFIQCPGYESCYDTASITAATDVYCSGSNSCQLSNSIDANNIYCAGTSGCSRAKLNTVGNVYCYGLYGCGGAKVQCDTDIFCGGSDSCYNAIITGGKSVNCEANEGCYGARITNVNKIGCMGTQSCRSVTIASGNSIRGGGYQSIYYATITGVTSVRAWGYQSLIHTTIDSDGLPRMTVEVYSDSYKSQVICQSGSLCTVSCKGTGCGGITYVCLSGATCNVSPAGCLSDNTVSDVDGATCPTFTDTQTVKVDVHHHFDPNAIIQADCARCTNCNAKEECATLAATQGATTRCNGEESCVDATFSETAVSCEGSRSCAEDIFGNDGKENTFCNGYQSCFNAEGSIGETGFIGFEYFPCAGESACAGATLKPHGDTSCKGSYSCSKSEINVTEYANVNVEGWHGASRSYIGGLLRQVNLYGYNALFLGTIDTKDLIIRQNEVPEIVVNAYGHLSGFQGTVICRTGRECTINCKSTGCQKLGFVCEHGAICNVNPAECDGRDKYGGIDCPARNNTDNADEYMDRKYEMEKDIYDRFDEYLDNIMENDRVGYDDYEHIMMFIEREMIFAQGEVIENFTNNYNNMDGDAMRLIGSIIICIILGFFMCLWYILTVKQNKDDEYILLN